MIKSGEAIEALTPMRVPCTLVATCDREEGHGGTCNLGAPEEHIVVDGFKRPPVPLKLDLGCGSNKRAGFFGVDQFEMPGVDLVLNLGRSTWPWPDNSVSEVHCSHFLEHLTQIERMHFMNELYRVMVPGAQAVIITPHWASNRAFGDLTHAWPPVSEMFYYYLNEEWRLAQAPHTDRRWNPDGFNCNFTFGAGYTDHPALLHKNEETKLFMRTWYKEACFDMNALLTKPLPPTPPIT